MGMTPDRAYDASASGDDRQPEMMLRTAVRKGDASEVLTVVVRILSRESCSVRSMYLDKIIMSIRLDFFLPTLSIQLYDRTCTGITVIPHH